MHDSRLEDQLRSALRAEGDQQPLTITTAELERRLILRRRARTSQRVSLVAAAVAVVAIGSIVAIGNGWLRMPAVGVDPSPSPSSEVPATDAPVPTAAPTTTAQPTPRVANPLGEGTQAILVRPTGADLSRPDTWEVLRVDPATGDSTLIATVPGTILPADGFIEEFGGAAPSISTTGRLAIPFRRESTEGASTPAIALVDVRAPDAEPWILNDLESVSWNEVDGLYARRGDEVWQVRVGDRYLARLRLGTAVRAMGAGSSGSNAPYGPAVASQDGVRLLGRDGDTPGAIGFDGTFTPTTDLPPVFQRSGLERPAGDSAHTLGEACDSGPTAQSSGCYLIESDQTVGGVRTWVEFDTLAVTHHVWASDGASIWLLVETGQTVTLTHSDAPGSMRDVARLEIPASVDQPAILGIIGEETAGRAAAVAIGTRDGHLLAIVPDGGAARSYDGTAWFAGWAVNPTAYDPD